VRQQPLSGEAVSQPFRRGSLPLILGRLPSGFLGPIVFPGPTRLGQEVRCGGRHQPAVILHHLVSFGDDTRSNRFISYPV
jgi:hypothetical protein